MAAEKGRVFVVLAGLMAGGAGVAARTCGKTVRHLDSAASVGTRHIDDTSRIVSKGDDMVGALPRATDEGSTIGSTGTRGTPGPYDKGSAAEAVAEEVVFQGVETAIEVAQDDSGENLEQVSDAPARAVQAESSIGPSVGWGQVLAVFGLLLLVLSIHNVAYTFWLLLVAGALRVQPLELRVGLGPRLFSRIVGCTEVVVNALPLQTSAIYRHDDREAENLPKMSARVLLALLPTLFPVLFALALLGTDAWSSFITGFSQLPDVLLYPNADGAALVERFAVFLATQDFALSAGVLFAKLGAASVLTGIVQPFLWFGVRETYPWWTMILVLLPMLWSVSVLINVFWAAV